MLNHRPLIAAFSAAALVMFPQIADSRPLSETSGYPVVSNSQENSLTCYMQTQEGAKLNLGRLCGEVGPTTNTAKKEAFQAPIKRRQQGIPVIDVTFNGTQTFEMLVDTGASVTVLTQQVAAALRVAPVGKAKVDTPSDKGVEMFLGRIASIEVAGAVARNTLVTVAPALDTGLLGQNFFGLYDITVKENVVEFRVRQR